MSKTWRPEGWENPTLPVETVLTHDEGIARQCYKMGFEAGADAILKALIEKGVSIDIKEGGDNFVKIGMSLFIKYIDSKIVYGEAKGKIVFIPNGEGQGD